MNVYADPELLKRIASDDENAFTLLYNRYWESIYILAYKHLHSIELAEEVVQEVFMVIWKKRKTLTQVLEVKAYLSGITRFEIYKLWAGDKKNAIKKHASANEPSSALYYENLLDHKFQLDAVTKLTTYLPEKCRLVFIYNKLLDLPLPEVAKILSISPKTAETHLTKALKFIRKRFGSHYFFVPLF